MTRLRAGQEGRDLVRDPRSTDRLGMAPAAHSGPQKVWCKARGPSQAFSKRVISGNETIWEAGRLPEAGRAAPPRARGPGAAPRSSGRPARRSQARDTAGAAASPGEPRGLGGQGCWPRPSELSSRRLLPWARPSRSRQSRPGDASGLATPRISNVLRSPGPRGFVQSPGRGLRQGGAGRLPPRLQARHQSRPGTQRSGEEARLPGGQALMPRARPAGQAARPPRVEPRPRQHDAGTRVRGPCRGCFEGTGQAPTGQARERGPPPSTQDEGDDEAQNGRCFLTEASASRGAPVLRRGGSASWSSQTCWQGWVWGFLEADTPFLLRIYSKTSFRTIQKAPPGAPAVVQCVKEPPCLYRLGFHPRPAQQVKEPALRNFRSPQVWP